LPLGLSKAARHARQSASYEPSSYVRIIRNVFGLGLIAAVACWALNPFNLRASFSHGELINDFLIVVPVVLASIAIEIEHCRRWGLTGISSQLPGLVLSGFIWVMLAIAGYLAGQQPAFFVLNILADAGEPVSYPVRVTVAIIAVITSLGGAALVWTFRIWISERRRMRGPQLVAETAEVFSAVLGMLNRVVHLFTGLVYMAGGVLILTSLSGGFFGAFMRSYIPAWMETIAIVSGVVAGFYCFAKGTERLVRAANLRPDAITGPHGSVYTATAADLRRAGVLR
jgi:hypothetical protein